MANFEVLETYNSEIEKLEPTTPGHADVFNAIFQQLINNDAFIKKVAEQQLTIIQSHLNNENEPHQKVFDTYYRQLVNYTDKAIADLINGAPETADTLRELADLIDKNKDVTTALNEAIGKKANQTELDQAISNINTLNSGLAIKYFLKVLEKDWSGFVGTLFPQFNVQGDSVVDIYADKTDGTYPAVRVSRAYCDSKGNSIPDTYMKKTDAKNNVSSLSNTSTNYHDQTPVVQYFTVPEDGYYLVTGLVTFSSNANGFREVFITNTTSNYVMGRVRVPAVSGGAMTLQVTSGGTFGPGQTGTLSTYQNSGSNLDVQEWLSMVKIAPKL